MSGGFRGEKPRHSRGKEPSERLPRKKPADYGRVPLEAYVARSVAGEVYAAWPLEALKAQAVVARTYALHQSARNAAEAHDVDSSVLSQRYEAGAISPRLSEAARATRREFLAYGDTPILAAFHASAGGHTASSEEVWGLDLPYLRSVQSPDDSAPHYFWSYEIELPQLHAALRESGYRSSGGQEVRVLSHSPSGRVQLIQIGSVRLSGRELRQVLGGAAIRSALFDVRVEDGDGVRTLRFLGSGAGHGVGMCQWGAHEMALQGNTYPEILAHYYPGTRLVRPDAADASRSAAVPGSADGSTSH